jgi:metallo-beta-lactamase class B
MKWINLSLPLVLFLSGCATVKNKPQEYTSNDLIIKKLTDNVFVHITYFNSTTFGKVPCNGMIYVQGNEAIVFDTPAEDAASDSLIQVIEKVWKKQVKAVVVNHFHADCTGGLAAFHKKGIPSYGNNLTLQLAPTIQMPVPQNGFDKELILTIGNQQVVNRFYGEAHTKDNIVSYIPSENVLFGGCMVKELKAGKGNLADANLAEWSNTIEKVKAAFPKVQWIIPGHGTVGGIDLLDYTIQMFRKN